MTDHRLTPAFPNPALADENWGAFDGSDGMTLRDYFAARAMAVILSNKAEMRLHQIQEQREQIANEAYKIADAMMEER